MSLRIDTDDLSRPEVHALLSEHLQDMHAQSPPGSVHALDLDGLRAPDLSFWTAWDGGTLLGCGALKQLSPVHGEVKSMRTPARLRRRGAGRALLAHLIDEARRRGYERLSLETGSAPAFTPAHRLYEAFGFTRCGPFGPYVDDPHSVFMTLALQPAPGPAGLQLVRPTAAHLPAYVAALERGWSPDNLRPEVAREELASLRADAAAFLAACDDPEAQGPPVTLPDGTRVRRLPSIRRWMWDGDFCGSIGLRWQPGTAELPPHVLGHIGYAVVPWKRGRGHATAALAAMLTEARARGLPFVELTTDPDNLASQRVITANGGVLAERFDKPAACGGTPGLRYRITLG